MSNYHSVAQAIVQLNTNINILCIPHKEAKIKGKTRDTLNYLIVDKTGKLIIRAANKEVLLLGVPCLIRVNVNKYFNELSSKLNGVTKVPEHNKDAQELLHWYEENYKNFIPEKEVYERFDEVNHSGWRINLKGHISFINEETYPTGNTKSTYTLYDERNRTCNVQIWNHLYTFSTNDLINIRNARVHENNSIIQYTIDELAEVSTRMNNEFVIIEENSQPSLHRSSHQLSQELFSSNSSMSYSDTLRSPKKVKTEDIVFRDRVCQYVDESQKRKELTDAILTALIGQKMIRKAMSTELMLKYIQNSLENNKEHIVKHLYKTIANMPVVSPEAFAQFIQSLLANHNDVFKAKVISEIYEICRRDHQPEVNDDDPSDDGEDDFLVDYVPKQLTVNPKENESGSTLSPQENPTNISMKN